MKYLIRLISSPHLSSKFKQNMRVIFRNQQAGTQQIKASWKRIEVLITKKRDLIDLHSIRDRAMKIKIRYSNSLLLIDMVHLTKTYILQWDPGSQLNLYKYHLWNNPNHVMLLLCTIKIRTKWKLTSLKCRLIHSIKQETMRNSSLY